MTNFTNRETYVAYVRAWKLQYQENSELIRQTKIAIKEAFRSGNIDEAANLQSRRAYLRGDQRNALIERAEAKEEAQRQYLAEHPEKMAA